MKCKQCGLQLIEAAGPPDSDILLLGDKPNYVDTVHGTPFAIDNRGIAPGNILKAELGRIGIPIESCRRTNLWQHEPGECNFSWHMDTAMNEVTGRRFVVLMGTDSSNLIFHKNITDVSGLVLEHEMYPMTNFIMTPSPGSVLHGTIGEFRFAIQQLEKLYE